MKTNEKLAKLAINKSLLKEYSNSSNDRIVYMKDNTEFQIQLFNPYNHIIGLSIHFNEKKYSNNMLVLKPGERIWLDRYLDDESKMRFNTYKVNNNNEQVKEAIKNNGNIVIKFYKENENNYISVCGGNLIINDENKNWWDDQPTWTTNNISAVPTSITTSYTSAAAASTCFLSNSSLNGSANTKIYSLKNSNNKIETGRIEKGSHSNQKFNYVNYDFENFPFKIENIKILPESTKPVYSNDIQKRYCHNCGRRLKEKFKFCPFCGAKQ